ncbi:hypothetical protein BD324DRAFT_625385 [Kockovaella imperatae]|uniref:FAD-binding domain-containing protein n=1 Tax=Kockovaella imperatae TaxID=4999 RepID=A0A1Y1UGQ5_9TREE|nr:hypothetical protein BD324DRAFT_625385 [Kockovaella imperatae]ORX37240.1 hypothetical protein BD324DRAFT_625385 [Kockovaella imperatae]
MKPVLIIGSGIGGLTLAQGLKRVNIPFAIYERDAAATARPQGYRIRIHGPALDDLEKCLEPSIYRQFEATAGKNVSFGPGGFGRIDARSGEKIQMGGPSRPGGGGGGGPGGPGGPGGSRPDLSRSLPIDRQTMRASLFRGLEPIYSKAFTKFTETETGVVATFADGTQSIEGSLLVGADGIYSKVARQLVPESSPLDTGSRMIFGKTPLANVRDDLLEELREGVHVVQDKSDPTKPLILFMEVMTFTHADAPEDYIYWVILGDPQSFGETDEELLMKKTDHAAAELSRHLTLDWAKGIKVILDHQVEDNTSILRMTTSNPNALPCWPTNRRATLLGDAIHCMPPTGGSGANTAIRDAALLVKTLADSQGADGWPEQVIKGYEDEMRQYAGEIVQSSYRAGVKAFGVKQMQGFPV